VVFTLVLFPDRIGIWRCRFSWREENRRFRRKTLGVRREPTTNSTHIWHRAVDRTRATLVEGEHPHHCAIPAPYKYSKTEKITQISILSWAKFACMVLRHFALPINYLLPEKLIILCLSFRLYYYS